MSAHPCRFCGDAHGELRRRSIVCRPCYRAWERERKRAQRSRERGEEGNGRDLTTAVAMTRNVSDYRARLAALIGLGRLLRATDSIFAQ